jgi:hypothetical protein
MNLIFGRAETRRKVPGVESLLRNWAEKEQEWGQLYLNYVPLTPSDHLVVEDLAVTMLLNSQVAAQAARSIYLHGDSLDLRRLPAKSLEETTDDERQAIAA